MSILPAELSTSYLVDLLLAQKLIDQEQARRARLRESFLRQKLLSERGGAQSRYRVSPIEVLAALELTMPDGRRLSEDRIVETLAAEVGIPYYKIDPLKLDGKLVTETLSRAFANHNVVLPIKHEAGNLVMAIADPFNITLRDSLRRTLPTEPSYVLSAKTDILKSIAEVYGFRSSVKAAAEEISHSSDLGNLEQYVAIKRVEEIDATDAHVVAAVEYLLNYAFEQRASDIHIEPKREQGIIRLRIDGILHKVYALPKAIHAPFVSRLKMLARMDIAEKRRPQDGRIKTSQDGHEVELRVSTMPTAFGEKIVIRIFDPQHLLQDLSSLGMHQDEQQRYESFITRSTGLVLVTGPTGSGKTTTLYSTLRALAGPEVNITTVEDPVEMVYEPFNQVQVHKRIDLTFASALRTVLRQDPDIVMIGEIRDAETATMAIQAALTGHLVFSTLHTNDAPSTITRLLDLGVKPFLLASTLNGIVAQRLMRTICLDCKSTTTLTDDQLVALELKLPGKQKRRLSTRFGAGCSSCRYTGLRGRVAIFEIMQVNQTIRNLIKTRADSSEIMKAARADGMLTLKEAAIRKLAEGETPFEEVVRVIGSV